MHGQDESIKLLWWGIFLQHQQKNDEGCSILNKENRSQNISLCDSTAYGHWGRATSFDSYSLSSV